MLRELRPRIGHGTAAAFLVLCIALGGTMALPSHAFAVDPEAAVGGNGSKWFYGDLLQMDGNNCDIIGSSKTETMVSAISGYGGAPGGQVVHVGDRYYASVLISIPGNPCGSGSSSVGTDLFLPRGTSVDTSAPIRCFGQPRNASTFGELTGGGWSFKGSSGRYCPAQVGASQSGAPGTIGVGFRPLANGALYYLFVPIKSTQTLEGSAHNPDDQIHWFISASATYVSPQATSAWVHAFPGGGGGTPFLYFARDPSAVPYWDNSAPSGQENKAEWFVNLYTAGHGGTLCFDLYDGDPPTGSPTNCSFATGWNGTVPAGGDSFQVFGSGANEGPNGGYSPFAYPPGQNTYTIRWTFTYDPGGGNQTITKDIAFTTLAGPDGDGDGVPTATDDCPTVAGTQANGCPSPVQTDPDGDGVFGFSDQCPNKDGGASLDGCPPKDSDGDGIPNSTDACPNVSDAGKQRNPRNGCPRAASGPKPTAGNDTLTGTPLANVICGLAGNDTIGGGAGNDTLFGDACNQKAKTIFGAAATGGDDKLSGDDGDDELYGAGGNDTLKGGKGKDKLVGGKGKDKLVGGGGVNSYKGGGGNDTIGAKNGKKETVDCGGGKDDRATVDKNDTVKNCEAVERP